MFGFPSGRNSHWGNSSLLGRFTQLLGSESCFPGISRRFPRALITITQMGWPRTGVGTDLTFGTIILLLVSFFIFVALSR